jgi:ATP-dependent protease ClpP protease subunit
MTKGDLLNLIKGYADSYHVLSQESIKRNTHMNDVFIGETVQQRHIDAVLVDFINFIAQKNCMDYGLYTKDLKSPSDE